MKMSRVLLLITLCLQAVRTVAQSIPSGISADITADRQAILIGEPMRLTLTVRTSTGHALFPEIPDSLPHFEILSKSKIDTVVDKNLMQLQQIIVLTSFDSGRWVIPAFDLPGTNIVTDSLDVDVQFIPMKPGDQVRDIKGIIPVSAYIPWWAFFASGALLIVLIFLLIRTLTRKKRKEEEAALAEPPYEEAMQALGTLQMPVASADIKPYYSRLDEILKRYLARAYGWKALQFTTTDLLLKLQDVLDDPGERSALAEALRMEDAVKFARFFPGNEAHQRSMDQVRKAIDILHKTEKTP